MEFEKIEVSTRDEYKGAQNLYPLCGGARSGLSRRLSTGGMKVESIPPGCQCSIFG